MIVDEHFFIAIYYYIAAKIHTFRIEFSLHYAFNVTP